MGNVDLRQGSLEALPIEKGCVDVGAVGAGAGVYAAPAAALREIRRILKPGGILLIIDLQPHQVELFRKELNHRWMGFSQEQLQGWLKEAGFGHSRWHPLSPKSARSKESATGRTATPIPDLFALRAEVGHG